MADVGFLAAVNFQVNGIQNVNSALRGVTGNVRQVSQFINTNVVPGFQKLGVNVKSVADLTELRLVGSIDKLDAKTKKLIGTTERYQAIVKRGATTYKSTFDLPFTTTLGPNRDPATGRFQSREQIQADQAAYISLKKEIEKPVKSPLADIDLGKLAIRAAATIPTWLALRAGIMGVIDILPNAIDRFKELDEASAEMKVMTDGANVIANFNQTAMDSLNKLSRDTGIAVNDLKNAYIAVSSTGIDATTSMSAMETISKGALATGADAKLLASTMSGLINTMGDTLEVGSTKAEKFQTLMVVLHSAMKTNAGSMNDFSEALGQAGASAATSGMKLTELIANVAVLQTAMVRAGMGGTALRTALDQVVQKRQEITNFMGRELTASENSNQFTLILSIIDRMKALVAQGDMLKAQEIMQSIFGVKAGKDVNVLRNNLDKFGDTIGDINRLLEVGRTQGIPAMMQEWNKDVETRLSTLKMTQQRFNEVMKESQSSLVGGFFGKTGSEWTDSFDKFIDYINKSQEGINAFGAAIREIITVGSIAALASHVVKVAMAFESLPAALLAARGGIAAFVGSAGVKALLRFAVVFAAIEGVTKLGGALTKSDSDIYKDSEAGNINSAFYSAGAKKNNFYEPLGQQMPDMLAKIQSDFKKAVREGYSGDLEDYARKTFRDSDFFKSWMQGVNSTIKVNPATGKPVASVSGGIDTSKMSTEDLDRFYKSQVSQLQVLKGYGVDTIQIKQRELQLIRDIYHGAEEINKLKDKQLEIETAIMERQLAYIEKTRSAIESSLLGNLQGKGNNLLSDIGASFTSQLQESMAKNLSNVIMSSGIGDQFATAFGFLDEGAKRITDPILKAHVDGAQRVHDSIVSAWDKVQGKSTASAGTAGYGGSGNGLSGIWGTSLFTQKPTYKVDERPDGFIGPMNATQTNPNAGQANFLGKLGAGASIGATTAVTASAGVQQMQGGGAKNIVGGLGQVGMSLGSGIIAATSAGLISSTGMLAAMGPIGLAIGAVLLIASLFMKGAKQTSTQSQTSETKVGSKIDISNKQLQLVNRNLLALKNSLETFALTNSAYFAEKSGSIDANFALSAKRSYA